MKNGQLGCKNFSKINIDHNLLDIDEILTALKFGGQY